MADDAMGSWMDQVSNLLGVGSSVAGEDSSEGDTATAASYGAEPAPHAQPSAGPEAEASWWDSAASSASEAVDTVSDWITGSSEQRAVSEEAAGDTGIWEEVKEAAGEFVDRVAGPDEEEEAEQDLDAGDNAQSPEENAWNSLSAAEQASWQVLGWNEERWNRNDPPASYFKSWWDLTDTERQAAGNLGYDQASWDQEEPADGEHGSDPLNQDEGWDDLSPAQQENWSVLGWDRERWNDNDPPASQFKSWSELSGAEQAAAGNLGYDQASWDQEGDSGVAGKVRSLQVRSENERALKARLLEVGFQEADNVSEYNALYDEVGAWLDLSNQAHSFQEHELTSWSDAITALAGKRRAMAGRMASDHWEKERDAAAKRVSGFRSSLAGKRASVDRILKAFRNADSMQEGVKNALTLKDSLQTLQNLLNFAANPTVLEALNSGISEFFNQVDPVGDAINKHVATIAAHVRQQAVQLEGFENMQELVKDIGVDVSNVKQAVNELAFYARKYEAAVALEAAPGG